MQTPFSAILAGLSVCSLLIMCISPALAQERPIPYPVMPILQFEQAVESGTRTESGEPGPNYWINRARYDLHATVSPWTDMLRGTGSATYFNDSPDTLRHVYVHLRQNLHAPGEIRNRPQQITGGMNVSDVRVDGRSLLERPASAGAGYTIDGTVMDIWLPAPIAPGDSAGFQFAWSFQIPEAGAPRMGQDGQVYYLGYWYPQFAVYDDVHGWVAEQYQGDGEFYMDHAEYDVAITVPEGFLIAATGELVNTDEVLTQETRTRLASITSRDDIYAIVAEDERQAGTSTLDTASGMLTWRFHAERIRDFGFGTSDDYVWDATLADAADAADAAETRIHTFYRPDQQAWARAAEFARYSIEYLSDGLAPYPYPQMTVVEGIIGGGMEYPMITLIGGERTEESLFGTTFHEISHMWMPMIVSQNEKQYAWMDEGLTVYNTNEAKSDFWDADAWNPDEQSYYGYAGTGTEVEPMRHADEYPYGSGARTVASYNKPAVALRALEWVLGAETFDQAYREYVCRWAFKHPYPYDLFNTFEDVAGQDLDWFWTSLFYETWTLDHAVSSVDERSNGVTVTVEDRGLTPMPALVQVTYEGGATASQVIPVDVWLSGERSTTLTFAPGDVASVEIDPRAYLPDIDRTNNDWNAQTSAASD
jgi:hypothetical protein